MKYLLLILTLAFSFNASASSYDNELLKLTNAERARYNLPALILNSRLGTAAQLHAKDMATHNYFSHTGLNGSTLASRANDAGYDYRYIGENIAKGYQTPEQVVTGWMNSKGHRDNILNSNYTEVGFGYADENDTYWVQLFGHSGSSTSTPVVTTPSILDKTNALLDRIEADFSFISNTNTLVSGSGNDAVYYRMYFNYTVVLVIYHDNFFLGEYKRSNWEFTMLSSLEQANIIFCDGDCWN